MVIDTHAHLTDQKFHDVTAVIKESFQSGVGIIIIPTVDVRDAEKAIKLAEKHKGIYVLCGIHPETIISNFDSLDNTSKMIAELRRVIQASDRVVGVGEIGLDYAHDKSKRTAQKQNDFLNKQLDLAVSLDLPVVIHSREADMEMATVLNSRNRLPPGQFHCFGGTPKILELVLTKGFYVSFAGNVTYKSADNLRALVRMVPRERLLLETDCPLLSPKPLRGSVNVPKNVKILAEYQAKLLNISPETLIEETTHNAKCLFSAI